LKNIVDFTDIDVYPSRYWVNNKNGQLVFTIRSINIENVAAQAETLGEKNTKIMTGDCIRVDTKFGHNIAKAPNEEWIDVPLVGVFQVLDFIPHQDTGELELKVRAI